jgi:hypothetical protein
MTHINHFVLPPKKRTYVPRQQQSTVAPITPHQVQHRPILQTNVACVPASVSQPIPSAIQNRFLQVEHDMALQKEWNAKKDSRMAHLEMTTSSTDNKIEMMLSMMESWDNPTKRRGIIHGTDERGTPTLHPGQLQPGGIHQ